MRYGVIADLHANLEALDAVLAHLDAAGVDRIVCLGDVVGYHANPNECVERVRDRCAVVIAGNHDRAVVGAIGMTEFGFIARRAASWTATRLAPHHAAYLRSLAVFAPLDSTARVVHAALAPEPNDRFHITTPRRIAANLEQLAASATAGGARICFFGHTHRPVVHGWRDGIITSVVGPTSIELATDRCYLINPGSVGQPRDGDWRAACAIYDVERARVDFLRIEYDVAAFRAKATAAGLLAPPGLARRALEAARSRLHDASDLAARSWQRARRK